MAESHQISDEAAMGRRAEGPTKEERIAALRSRADAVLANPPPRKAKPPPTIDEQAAKWVSQASKLFRDGARLAEAAEQPGVTAGMHTAMALLIYSRMTEKAIDATLRQILEEDG